MAFGLGWLRLPPADFWAMAPRELAAAMAAVAPPPSAPGRGVLDELMQRFPDVKDRRR